MKSGFVLLSAPIREVVGLFFYRGVKLGLIGLAIGLPLGIVVLRFLSTQFLLPFPNASALSLVMAPLVLAVTAIATWIPARRAAGVGSSARTPSRVVTS